MCRGRLSPRRRNKRTTHTPRRKKISAQAEARLTRSRQVFTKAAVTRCTIDSEATATHCARRMYCAGARSAKQQTSRGVPSFQFLRCVPRTLMLVGCCLRCARSFHSVFCFFFLSTFLGEENVSGLSHKRMRTGGRDDDRAGAHSGHTGPSSNSSRNKGSREVVLPMQASSDFGSRKHPLALKQLLVQYTHPIRTVLPPL